MLLLWPDIGSIFKGNFAWLVDVLRGPTLVDAICVYELKTLSSVVDGVKSMVEFVSVDGRVIPEAVHRKWILLKKMILLQLIIEIAHDVF